MTDVRRIVAENRRYVYLLGAALAINLALYVLVVFPLSQRVASAEQEAGEATRQVVTARASYASAQGTITGKKEADAELRKFYEDVLPAGLSAARRTLYPRLEQLARASRLTPQRSGWEPDTGKDGDLRKLTLTMTLTGEYSGVRRFIHQLETAPEFLVLESVTVTSEAEDRELNVVARVATYYRASADGN